MKYLILPLILFSNLVHAENWLNHSKIKSGSVEAYSLKSDCERISGEECFDLGNYPSSVFSESTVEVDDLNKPIYTKRVTYNCGEYCQSLWNEGSPYTDCLAGESPILNLELKQIYCIAPNGFEKKLLNTIILDQNKVQARENQKNLENFEKQKEQEIQLAIDRMEHGRRVIAVMITRNNAKSLTPSQIQEMNNVYIGIKTLLDTGSLQTAKLLITSINPDGVLVTIQDKEALIAEINKYPGLN